MSDAGLHTEFGVLPGRRREWDVEPNVNLMVQDPANIIEHTANMEVGVPYAVKFSIAAATNTHTNAAIYECPTGWTVQVLDLVVVPTSAEASATVQPLKGTTAICTAIVSAVSGVPGRPIAGWNTTAAELTGVSGSETTLRLLDAGGTNTPSREGFFTLMRTA